MYRINPFVRLYRRKNIVALFNSLNLATIYIKESELNNLIKSPDAETLKSSIVVPSDFNAVAYFTDNTPDFQEAQIDVVYFLLTSHCNFQCKYCFVETRINDSYSAQMTDTVAENALQMLKNNIRDRDVTIVFYGGEPFVNFECIQFIAKRSKELNIKAHFVVITNGGVMTEEIVSFIKENNLEVGISLDGTQEINDTMRVDANNQGTYNKIEHSIHILLENGIKPGISCTLSKHNLDRPQDIIQVLEKYNLKNVAYNLPAPNGNIKIDENSKRILINNLLVAETTLLKKEIIEDKIIDRRLRSFVEKTIWLRDCAAYGQQLVISPKGKIGVCHGLWPDDINGSDNTYYNIDTTYNDKVAEHPSWKEWNMRIPYNMPQCWNCSAISLCGGGCAKNALLQTGTIWDVDRDICLLMEQTIPWLIWNYYDVISEDNN